MKKIVVIDDEVDILRIIKMLLESRDFSVYTSPRWEDIYSIIGIFRPDLIMLDISLNGADGRVLCNSLKTNVLTQEIPVLLYSANHGVEKTLRDSKADGFIAKPFKAAALFQKINEVLNRMSFHH